MKKLDYSNPGGLEFFIQNLQFTFESNREALEGAFSWLEGLNADPIIVSGIVISEAGGNYTHTAGWLYYQGEFVRVDALTVPAAISAADYYVSFEDKVLPEGSQVCEDSSPADCHIDRIAKITRGAIGIKYSDCIRWNKALIAALTEEPWIVVGGGGGAPNYSAGWSGTLNFKLNRFGELEFFGYAENAALNVTNEQIMVLPLAYRPSADIHLVVGGLENAGAAPIMLKIMTTGSVILTAPIYGTSKKIYLAPVRLRLA